jgi:hypothetical protein
MKKKKIKETSTERTGREFLEAFKKLPYSTDRIGQSFVMPVSRKTVEASDQKQESFSEVNDAVLAKNLSAREKGREFLDRFKKLDYNRERIGQTAVINTGKKQNQPTEAKTSIPEEPNKGKKLDVSVNELFSTYHAEQKKMKQKQRVHNLALWTAFLSINGVFALVIGWIFWRVDLHLFVNFNWSIWANDMKPDLFLWFIFAFFFPSGIITFYVFKVLKIEDQ